MRILIDVDDTFWDFMNPVLNYLNKEHNLSINKSEVESWTYLSDMGIENPFACTADPNFWKEVNPFPNAIEVIESFVKQGHEIYFVTASYFNNGLSTKIQHLLSFFNNELINERNIIIAQDKNVISGDILIDDGIHNLSKFYGNTICYNQPWNKEWIILPEHGYYKASDWFSINENVEQIYEDWCEFWNSY